MFKLPLIIKNSLEYVKHMITFLILWIKGYFVMAWFPGEKRRRQK